MTDHFLKKPGMDQKSVAELVEAAYKEINDLCHHELRREIENAKHAPHHAPQTMSHAPKPTYQCEQCGASFESSGRLAAHVRWGHAAIATRNGHEKEKL